MLKFKVPRRLLAPIAVGLLCTSICAGAALAQTAPTWRIVQASDGSLYAISGGVRYELSPDPIGDADLAALTDAGPTSGALPALDASQAPASAPATNTVPQAGAVQFVSVSGGRPGTTASVAVQASPGVQCSIAYTTPAGTRSTAQGLTPKLADSSGAVNWSWLIGGATRAGTGSVSVTCGGTTITSAIVIG
jgi:hypothetical protein